MTAGVQPETVERPRWPVLAGVWAIYFTFGTITASMAPVISEIRRDIDMTNAGMGFVLGAWPLAYILCALPCGVLLHRIGARRMLAAAALIMAASAAARGFAETPAQLFLAVALFGAGGPLISVGAPLVIARLYKGKARSTAMGFYVTGPYLGGLVSLAATNSVLMPLAGQDWRGVMLFYATGALLAGLLWLLVSAGQSARLGVEDGVRKFNLSAFGDILRVVDIRFILAMSVGIFFINHGLNNWIPEVLRSHGYSAVTAGYHAAFPAAIGVLAALVIPRLATGRHLVPVLAGLAAAVLMASLLLQFSTGPLLLSGLLLQGVARGAMMTLAIMLLMETPGVPEERLGLAGGLFFTAAEVGGVVGPATFGLLAWFSGGFVVPLASMTLVACAVLALLAVIGKLRNGRTQA